MLQKGTISLSLILGLISAAFGKPTPPAYDLGKGQPAIIFLSQASDLERLKDLSVKVRKIGKSSALAAVTVDELNLLYNSGFRYQLIDKRLACMLVEAEKQIEEAYPSIVWVDYPSYGEPSQPITVSIQFKINLPPTVNTISAIIWQRTSEGSWTFEFVDSKDVTVYKPGIDTTVSFTYSLPDTHFVAYEYWIGVGYSYGGSDYYSWFCYLVNMPYEPMHEKVAMIVDDDVYYVIEDKLLQYKSHVEVGYDATINIYHGTWTTPESLRSYLKKLWVEENITGAILVGLLPYAMWEPVWDEPPFPIPLFYEDLDGEFIDEDGDNFYDWHEWGANQGCEIWVTWMRPPADNPSALHDFLIKCIDYYEFNLPLPPQALECINYDWRGAAKPFYINLSHIYGKAVDTVGGGEWRVSGQEYLQHLSTYGYEITHIWCHSGSDVHCFDLSPWVYWYDIRDIQPGSWFYLLWACHGANFHDEPSHNLAINYCMGRSSGLASLGVTRSIGTGTQEVLFNSLAYGKDLARAYFDFINYEYDSTWVRAWWSKELDPHQFVWDFCFIGNPFVKFPGTLEGPPAPPRELTATPTYLGMRLVWKENWEADLLGYNVYSSNTSGGPYNKINSYLVTDTTYEDTGLQSGVWYYYVVTAVDTANQESHHSLETSGIPISLDHGILVVDETRDGTGAPGSPTDEQVDNFYRNVLRGYTFAEWDYTNKGSPSIWDIGLYSTVIWHGDDYAHQQIYSVLPDLRKYLDAGGKLWIVGWRPVAALMGGGTYPFYFEEGNFLYDYLKLSSGNESKQIDFVGADGQLGFPSIRVDSTKIPQTWGGKLKYIDVFTTFDAEVMYTFNSASGDTIFDNKPCGVGYFEGPHMIVLFGFPLYFMEEEQARAVARRILYWFGEPTSVAEIHVARNKIQETRLFQNYPNPFSQSTVIRLEIPISNSQLPITLTIYDLSGRLVRTLIDKPITSHQSPITITWDGKDNLSSPVPSGIYFCQLKTQDLCVTKKMIIMR